jgi:hypothetical protein
MRIFIVFLVVVCVSGGSVWAQDSGTDSSEDYVLQKAREEYSGNSGSGDDMTEFVEAAPAEEAAPASSAAPPADQSESKPGISVTSTDNSLTIVISGNRDDDAESDGAESRNHPYFPFVYSFVPGVSIPFGIWDTSLSVAPIGAITGSVHGLQGAGIFNIADGDVQGVQGSGIFNIVEGDFRGLQGAGIFNIVHGHARGVQGAGIFNISGGANAVQGAGLFNIADNINGVQAAGLFNIADSMRGVQAAGLFNIAGDANGVMIGVVNVAENLDGLALGLVNIIGNGIHDISVDYQFDSGMTYATYRSGTPFLYAAFYAGQPFENLTQSANDITFGAGLGHRFKFLFLTADVDVCMETPLDIETLSALSQAIQAQDPDAIVQLESWKSSFASVRATFGFGDRRGFGPYVGIKTDIDIAELGAVPEIFRSSFGSTTASTVTLFGNTWEIWPKLFLGVKF